MQAIERSGIVARALKIASRCSPEDADDADVADRLAKLSRWHVAKRHGLTAGKVTRVVGVSRVAGEFSCESLVIAQASYFSSQSFCPANFYCSTLKMIY